MRCSSPKYNLISVERTPMIAHIYSSVLQAVSGGGYAGCLDGCFQGYRDEAMHYLGYELPTCLTLVGSLVVSRAAKLLGYRLLQGSLANFLSPTRWVGLFSACVLPVPAACEVTQKRYVCGTKSECPSRATMVAEVRPKRRCARMKVLIGVDPHKASLAVAAVEEATGELLKRASFPQDRAGLSALERWAKQFRKRRPKRWRTPVV